MRVIIKLMRYSAFILVSCNAGNENHESLKNVEIGMHIEDVHSIMANEPVAVRNHTRRENVFLESYQSEFGASDWYNIYYSKNDSLVIRISWGE